MPIFHALDDTALLALEVNAWREAARCALEFQRRHDRSIHVILRDALNSANDFWQQVRAARIERGLTQTQTVA
jgi:hypothetical protein